MKKTAFILIAFFSIYSLFSDTRTDSIDVFLLIDKSKSMNDYGQMRDMINWVEQNIVESMLQPGDWIYISTFCGTMEHVVSMQIEDKSSINHVAEAVRAIKPDGYYTDMGMALDTLEKAVAERSGNGKHKYAVLLTDMIQQAAPESPYRAHDRDFTHAMLKTGSVSRHHRWRQVTVNVNVSADRIKAVSERCYMALQNTEIDAKIDIPLASF